MIQLITPLNNLIPAIEGNWTKNLESLWDNPRAWIIAALKTWTSSSATKIGTVSLGLKFE